MIISNIISVVIYMIALAVSAFTTAFYIMARPNFFDIKRSSFLCFLAAFIFYTSFELISAFFDVTENLKDYFFAPKALSDLFFLIFVISWLGILSEISGKRLLIPIKVISIIASLYFVFVEIMVFIHSDLISLHIPAEYNQKIIMGMNAFFDLMMALLITHQGVSIFKSGRSREIKAVMTILCSVFLLYMLIILYCDAVGYRIMVDGVSYVRIDPMIPLLVVAWIAILIVYKKHLDIKHIRRAEKAQEIKWQEIYDKYELTDRELEIIMLLQNGYDNIEIAKKICVSENTVKKHLNHIFSKTDTKNKYELLALIVQIMMK